VTQNAATMGLSWNMTGILPDGADGSIPHIKVDIHGLTYRYTMVKDPNTGATVYVRNKDLDGNGYVFEERDDWIEGNPGGTIQKYVRFPYTSASRFGDGSIDVEGDGQVIDPNVTYNYRLEVDDRLMMCSATPLADPACPGFNQALLDYLNKLEVSPDDPFYDEWVQANLSLNDEEGEQEVEETKMPEEKLSNFEKELGGENTIEDLVNTNQQRIFAALAAVPKIEPYYMIDIPGGEYEETLTLEDTSLPDNPRAMRNLASDANHKKMVRSQYDREQ